ncbi:MAG TPA: ATP synthase F1 subunit epsilon [Candidatus Saccharimonadales bacterium]
MKLELITLTGEKLAEDVYEVTLPTRSGDISIFPGHETMVTLATDGALYVRRKRSDRDDAREVYALGGGVVQVSPKLVRVLVDEAESADELAVDEIEAALERAKKQRASAKDAVSVSEAEALMNRATTRLKVANLRRRHR